MKDNKIMFSEDEPKRHGPRAIAPEDRKDLSFCPWCKKLTHTSSIKYKQWLCGECGKEKSIEYFEKQTRKKEREINRGENNASIRIKSNML